MTTIVAISGKKQAGKTTLANFLHGYELVRKGIIQEFQISEEGKLVVNCVSEDSNGQPVESLGVLDLSSNSPEFYDYAEQMIWPHIKLYNFADSLKEICIGLFDIPSECVYGTDEQKNQIQEHLRWENMPGVICWPNYVDCCGNADYSDIEPEQIGLTTHNSGPMTAREFMQFLGTDIMRRMYEPIWTKNCIKRIYSDNPEIAIIADCRFPNEADAIIQEDGLIIRLTRNIYECDHKSETALDSYSKFSSVLDNKNLSINESCEEFLKIAIQLGITKAMPPRKTSRFSTPMKAR
jgi:hypothetical protein